MGGERLLGRGYRTSLGRSQPRRGILNGRIEPTPGLLLAQKRATFLLALVLFAWATANCHSLGSGPLQLVLALTRPNDSRSANFPVAAPMRCSPLSPRVCYGPSLTV